MGVMPGISHVWWAFLEPLVRRADCDGPCRVKHHIPLQPKGGWTHRCVLFSPDRALKIRKAGTLLCMHFLKGHRHWCQCCHLERSREDRRRSAVSCPLLHSVHVSLSACNTFPAEPTHTGQQGREAVSLSQIMRPRVTSWHVVKPGFDPRCVRIQSLPPPTAPHAS